MPFTRKIKGGKPHSIRETFRKEHYDKALKRDVDFSPGFKKGDVIENIEQPGEIKVIQRRGREDKYYFTDGSSEYIQEHEIIRNPDSEIIYLQKWRIVHVGAGKRKIKTKRRRR
jgi:hypothetical protein